ncbi:hypothetical protein, partial [Nocardiopsis protaetiae]|uniref:hypothetical protein n=1 Tax=Nocardiopsis protaetiae TaxID=3382270 RepID=UPI00387B6C68
MRVVRGVRASCDRRGSGHSRATRRPSDPATTRLRGPTTRRSSTTRLMGRSSHRGRSSAARRFGTTRLRSRSGHPTTALPGGPAAPRPR